MLIRRAVPGEEAVVRGLRFAALRTDPLSFSSTIEVELGRSPEEWASWVDPGPTFLAIDQQPDRRPVASDVGAGGQSGVPRPLAPVAVEVPLLGDGLALGLAGAIPPSADPEATELVGLWVAPLVRRSGAGSALVEAVVQHAVEQGAERVLLGVAIGNDPAGQLYERHGFIRTGRVARALRPGVTEVEMVLDLRRSG